MVSIPSFPRYGVRIQAPVFLVESVAKGRSIPGGTPWVRPFPLRSACILAVNLHKGGLSEMGKRLFCLLFAVVLTVMSVCGLRVSAADWSLTKTGALVPAKSASRANRRPNALASAMFLVLGGVCISMLFDKRR